MARRMVPDSFLFLLLGAMAFGQAAFNQIEADAAEKPTRKTRKATGKRKTQSRAEARKAYLEKYDKNKDGKLDAEERQAARADYQKNRKSKSKRTSRQQRLMQQLLARFDKNKDGKFDDKELAEIRKAIAKQQQQLRKRFQSLSRGKGGSRGRRSGSRSRRGGSRGRSGGRDPGAAAFRKLQQLRLRYLQQLQKQRQGQNPKTKKPARR